MTARTDRIDQLLREEIGAILAKDVQDPRIGFVTVTDVETAPDLSTARVWVSVIGQPEERVKALRALEHAMPFVRRELGGRIRIRRIPELLIREDESAQRGTRVLRLLAELEAGGEPAEAPEAEESLPTPTPRGTTEDPTQARPRAPPRRGRGGGPPGGGRGGAGAGGHGRAPWGGGRRPR